jgi:hypothetical protein
LKINLIEHADTRLIEVQFIQHADVFFTKFKEVEYYVLGRPDGGDHVSCPAVDGHVVARAQLEGTDHVVDHQERLLDQIICMNRFGSKFAEKEPNLV